jgi:hypothetical protein
MGLIIANVDEAPLVLKRLTLPLGVFESPNQVMDRIAKHYIQVIIREWYKILGAAEFLGAPGSFISHLGVGFHDFFSKSAQGLAQSPTGFSVGLYTGTKSLVQHSVHAVANTTAKVSNTVGTGMAMLTFDEDFQRNRATAATPSHVGEGLYQGAWALGSGVVSGITGVVTQPIIGASEGGFMGGIRGAMKGLTGIIVKPAVGAVDLITKTNEGLTSYTREVRKRVRYPRYVGPEQVVRVYNALLAKGQYLLWNANDGQHRNEYYVAHAAVMGGNVVIGNQSIMFVLEDEKSTRWTFRTAMIREIIRERPQLVLRLHEPVRDSALGQAYDTRTIQPRSNDAYDHVYAQLQLGITHRPSTPLTQ